MRLLLQLFDRSVTLVGEKGRKVLKEAVKQAKCPVKSRLVPQEVVVRYRDRIKRMEKEVKEIMKQEEEEKQVWTSFPLAPSLSPSLPSLSHFPFSPSLSSLPPSLPPSIPPSIPPTLFLTLIVSLPPSCSLSLLHSLFPFLYHSLALLSSHSTCAHVVFLLVWGRFVSQRWRSTKLRT